MSINIPTWFTEQYSSNIQMDLQQTNSRLSGLVMTGNHVGKQVSPVNTIGAIEMTEVTGRFEDIGRVDAGMDRRWVVPTDWDLPQLIDTFDELKTITDPKSVYVRNAVAAINRRKDRSILSAFFASALTGTGGATSTAYDTNNTVAVNFGSASNVGLTAEKLKEVQRLAMSKNIDLDAEPLYAVISSDEHADLLNDIQVISKDYNAAPVVESGRVRQLFGIQFIVSELIKEAAFLDGSSYHRVPVFTKQGMYLSTWKEPYTSVSKRNDLKSEPWQAYSMLSLGATRIDEDRVFEIKCA